MSLLKFWDKETYRDKISVCSSLYVSTLAVREAFYTELARLGMSRFNISFNSAYGIAKSYQTLVCGELGYYL